MFTLGIWNCGCLKYLSYFSFFYSSNFLSSHPNMNQNLQKSVGVSNHSFKNCGCWSTHYTRINFNILLGCRLVRMWVVVVWTNSNQIGSGHQWYKITDLFWGVKIELVQGVGKYVLFHGWTWKGELPWIR